MATRARLEQALINADAAGDVEAAKAFAAAIRNGQYDDAQQQVSGQQEQSISSMAQTTDVPLVQGMQGYEEQQAAQQAAYANTPANQPRSFLDKAIGAGEAGLAAATGSTTGFLGNIAGTISGIGKSIASGTYGTSSAADLAEQEAANTGASLTYSPRTQAGQEYTKAIGEFAAPLAAVAPFTQELGVIGQSARSAVEPRSMALSKESPRIAQAVEQAPKQISQAEKTADLTASFANAGMKNRIDEILKNVDVDPEKVDAANRLNIKSPLAVVSNNRSLQEIAGAIAASPGSKAAAELADFHQELTSSAQRLIKDAGGDIDKGLVSSELKDKMDSNIKLLKLQSSDIYKQIGDSVPAETIVNAKPLIKELNYRAGKSQRGIDGLSQVEQDVYKTLQGKPTYFDLDNLRKDIGESIGGFKGTYTTAPKAKLDDMYSKLTELQSGVADQVGAGAGKLWEQAKNLDKSRFDLQESSQFLFGKDLQGSVMPKVEQGLKQLAKGNSKTFNETLDSIPLGMRQRVLMSGLDSVINKTVQGESVISPAQFNTWYGDLSKSPTNKRLLHKNLPDGAGQRLDDLFKLSQGLQNVTSKVVRTGIVHDAFKNFDATGGLVDRLYNTAEKVSQVPIVGAAIGAPAIRVGSSILKMGQAKKTPAIQAADDLLSSSDFRSAVLDYQKSGKTISKAHKKLKISKELKNYIKYQSPKDAAKITSIGIIPYLVSQDEEE